MRKILPFYLLFLYIYIHLVSKSDTTHTIFDTKNVIVDRIRPDNVTVTGVVTIESQLSVIYAREV